MNESIVESLQRGVLRAAFISALVAGLAACGGGDSTDTPSATRQSAEHALAVTADSVGVPITLQKVAERRINRTVYEYDYKVQLLNGDQSQKSVTALLAAAGKGTTIVKADAYLGDIQPNALATSYEIVRLRHDRAVPFDQTALKWKVIGASSAQAVIGVNGGTLAAKEDALSIYIPAGALEQNVLISMVRPDSPAGPVGAVGDFIVRFSPDGAKFKLPVSIRVKFDPASVSKGMPLNQLTLAYVSGDTLVAIPTTVDIQKSELVGLTDHFSDYVQTWLETSKVAFGAELGQYMGVIAYSNYIPPSESSNYVGDYATGLKWECVEFISRFYFQVFGRRIREPAGDGKGDAKQFYKTSEERGLDRFANDGTNGLPQPGDIVVSESGTHGHVAIVKEVVFKDGIANELLLIQQNFFRNAGDVAHPVSITEGKVGNFSNSYSIVGWLRAKPSFIDDVRCSPPVVGMQMVCTLSGSNLQDTITFSATNCGPSPMSVVAGSTPLQRQFSCTPVAAGVAVEVSYSVPGFNGPLQAVPTAVASFAEFKPAGSPFRINTAIPIAQYGASLAVLAGGGFVIAWDDTSQGGGLWNVKSQMYSADGTPIGSELLVNSPTPLPWNLSPLVNALKDGGFVIFWESFYPGSRVLMQRFSGSGIKVGQEVAICQLEGGDGDCRIASVASLPSGGFAVAWYQLDTRSSNSFPSATTVHAKFFDSNGLAIGVEQIFGPNVFNVKIAPNSSDSYILAWGTVLSSDCRYSNVNVRILGADGAVAGTPISIYPTPGSVDRCISSFHLNEVSDGHFSVSWAENTNKDTSDNIDILARVFFSSGEPASPPIEIFKSTDIYLAYGYDSYSVASLSTGDLAFAWTMIEPATEGSFRSSIRGKVVSSNGASISAQINISSALQISSYNPEVLAFEDGSFAVGFSERSGENFIGRFSSAGTALGTQTPLGRFGRSNAGYLFDYPSIYRLSGDRLIFIEGRLDEVRPPEEEWWSDLWGRIYTTR